MAAAFSLEAGAEKATGPRPAMPLPWPMGALGGDEGRKPPPAWSLPKVFASGTCKARAPKAVNGREDEVKKSQPEKKRGGQATHATALARAP